MTRARRVAAPREGADLVARIGRGETDALAQLYDRFSAVLLGLAQQILGDRSEAEDLVHDVFIEAWRHAASYDPAKSSVRTWLLVRLRSRAVDRLRGHPRREAALRRFQSEPRDDAEAKADLSRPTQHGLLARELAALPADQRTVVMMVYFVGATGDEIADELGLPVGTVKSRLRTALLKLRQRLGGEGGVR